MSSNRIVALVVVALIHAVIGYAFVTGLAYQYVKKAQEKLTTFEVEEPPPPPEEVPPPPPPPDQPMQPPPVVTPPPIVQTTAAAGRDPVGADAAAGLYRAAAGTAGAAAAPPPPPPKISQKAGLQGNPGQFFGRTTIRRRRVRNGEEGRVVATLTVGTDGRVTDCRVTTSSGSRDLDDATCRIARSRVRLHAGEGRRGQSDRIDVHPARRLEAGRIGACRPIRPDGTRLH